MVMDNEYMFEMVNLMRAVLDKLEKIEDKLNDIRGVSLFGDLGEIYSKLKDICDNTER